MNVLSNLETHNAEMIKEGKSRKEIAEPFKLWLANLDSERIEEVFDPEIAVNRAVLNIS